jgi:hypothetical protein
MEAYSGGEVKLHFDTALSHGRFNPGERASVPSEYEVGWNPEPVWTLWRRENTLLPPPGIEPRFLSCPAPILITIMIHSHGLWKRSKFLIKIKYLCL